MKVHPIPYTNFGTTRSGFIKIFRTTKIAHLSEIFGLLGGWVKIHQILHVIFETTFQFFFKFCITLQCHEK